MPKKPKSSGIKKGDVIPEGLQKGIVAQEITSDFVLEIYEKAKRARSQKRKDQYLAIAEELSKHIGEWLVE